MSKPECCNQDLIAHKLPLARTLAPFEADIKLIYVLTYGNIGSNFRTRLSVCARLWHGPVLRARISVSPRTVNRHVDTIGNGAGANFLFSAMPVAYTLTEAGRDLLDCGRFVADDDRFSDLCAGRSKGTGRETVRVISGHFPCRPCNR